MKKLISIIAALILLSAVPGIAAAAPPDWTLMQIPGSQGDGAPVFFDINYPESDITLDADDNMYIMNGSKVIRFTPEGKADTSWGKGGILYDGELGGENSEMQGIAADSRGYVYVLCRICEDGSPTFIKRYTPNGEADKSWYGDGIMGGKFAGEDFTEDAAETAGGIRNGDAIALDSKDNLYVLYDREVYKFLPDGTPDKKWRKVKMVQPQYEYGVVWFFNAMRIDREDNLYLFNGYDRIVSKYSKTGRLLKRQKCPLYYTYGEIEQVQYLINQVTFDNKGYIYNINPEGNISKYSSKYKLISGWCGGALAVGKESEPVQTISDFEIDTAGSIYILDEGSRVISKYTNTGEPDRGWGANGSIGSVNGDGRAMLSVTDIVPDNDGSMYALSDYYSGGSAVVSKISPDFTVDSSWGADVPGSYKGYMTGAYNSITAGNGALYVKRNLSGVIDGVIKLSEGIEDPGWEITSDGPIWDLQTDGSGNIYAAGKRITKYLPDGKIDENWGLKGSIDGVSSVGEMAVDSSGYLYISDRGNDCVLKYTPGGQLDINWGEDGKADIPGAAEDSGTYYSYFIAADSAGNLYLSDYLNDRILRFGSEGRLDTSWCSGGEWRSSGSPGDLMPIIHPTHLMIRGGRLYAIWNDKLYVMNDAIARVGIKAILVDPSKPAEKAVSAAKTLAAWQWAVSIGGLLFCAGAVTAMILLLPKKNKRRRMTRIKSIKIAKRIKLTGSKAGR